MTSVATALNTFFNSFDIPAYTADTVPDDVVAPYIAYKVSEPEAFEKASGYAQVWYRTKSNAVVFAKSDAIVAAIGFSKQIDLANGGHLVIYPETPVTQLMVNGDYRAAVVNFSINAYHMPGT